MASKRASTNPAPKTEAARAQLSTFHCSLCNKGYARANEFAAHESSYEHNHAQRRKDLSSMKMKMAKNSLSGKGEEDGVMKVKPISFDLKKKGGGGGGFKKGGFKSAFSKVGGGNEAKEEGKVVVGDGDFEEVAKVVEKEVEAKDEDVESEEEEGFEPYDPKFPTGCDHHACTAPQFDPSLAQDLVIAVG